MKLQVLRFSSESDSTNGLLFDVTEGVKFLAYTLEDEKRDEKVMSETRIPAGTYEVKLGDSQENNQIKENGFIGSSSNAYKRIYPSIAEAIENEKVTIEYIDID